jgi:phosphatidate cytidylyltransferase
MVPLSRPKSSFDENNFGKRVLSTAIGGPIAVGAVILGSPYVDVLAILLSGILLWEWSKMSGLPLSHPMNGMVAVLLGWIMVGSGAFIPTLCIIGVGILYTLFYHYQLGARFIPSVILLSGPLYIGLGMAANLSLAKFAPLTLLWALLIVWATDIGAYVVGSLIGGPKLIPRISPGKTWSGFIGGSMLGSALGVALAPTCQIEIHNPVFLFSLTLMITFVGHTGDIIESAAKRLFNVKDSSHIIPGHGGLLDRMDSLLLVALFLIILKFFSVF